MKMNETCPRCKQFKIMCMCSVETPKVQRRGAHTPGGGAHHYHPALASRRSSGSSRQSSAGQQGRLGGFLAWKRLRDLKRQEELGESNEERPVGEEGGASPMRAVSASAASTSASGTTSASAGSRTVSAMTTVTGSNGVQFEAKVLKNGEVVSIS